MVGDSRLAYVDSDLGGGGVVSAFPKPVQPDSQVVVRPLENKNSPARHDVGRIDFIKIVIHFNVERFSRHRLFQSS